MSTSKKVTPQEELERINHGLIDSVMSASGAELRMELSESGINPDVMIAEIDGTIAAARAECAQAILRDARAALREWRKQGGKTNALALETARAKLNQIRSGDRELDEKMMLAARKGEGLSHSDMEGLVEDLAALERLEGEDVND